LRTTMRKPVRFYGADLSHVNLGKSRSSVYKPNDPVPLGTYV